MSWIDIAVLVLFAIFIVAGLIRGFWKTLASLLGTLICLLLAYVLTTFLLDKILSIPGLHKLFYGESGSLAAAIGGNIKFGTDVTVADAAADPTKLGLTGFWTLLSPIVTSVINTLNKGGIYNDVTVANCLSVIAARMIGWVIVFFLFFIILKLLSLLFRKIGDLMKKREIMGAIDRLLGLVLGMLHGFLTVIIVLFALNFFRGVSFMNGYFEELDNKAVIAKPLSILSSKLINNYIDVESLTGGLIKPASDPTPDPETPETPETPESPDEGTDTEPTATAVRSDRAPASTRGAPGQTADIPQVNSHRNSRWLFGFGQ